MEDDLLLQLRLRNTSLLKVVFDSLDLIGRIIRPALLNTRSLAAELAGTVNSLRASGLSARKRLSLKITSPAVMSLSEVNNAYCLSTSATVSGACGLASCARLSSHHEVKQFDAFGRRMSQINRHCRCN